MAPVGSSIDVPGMRERSIIGKRGFVRVKTSGDNCHKTWSDRLCARYGDIDSRKQNGSSSRDGSIDSYVNISLQFSGYMSQSDTMRHDKSTLGSKIVGRMATVTMQKNVCVFRLCERTNRNGNICRLWRH